MPAGHDSVLLNRTGLRAEWYHPYACTEYKILIGDVPRSRKGGKRGKD